MIAAALCAAVLVGCGSSDSDSSPTTTGTVASVKPLGPPPDKESIQQAEKRIAETASSKDCATVNELNPISRPAFSTDDRCKFLEIVSTDPIDAAQYGDAGVIEYELAEGTMSVLLVRDADGLFHIAYLNPRVPEPSIGTKIAPEFDQAAQQAVDALRDGDCDAFMKVAFVEFGPGSGDRAYTCGYVENLPLAKLLKQDPKAKPEPMGGNGTFAFYGLSLPGSFWTMILARQTQEDRFPEGAEPLPEDAPEYAYLDSFRTNAAQPPAEADGGSS